MRVLMGATQAIMEYLGDSWMKDEGRLLEGNNT